MLASPSGCLCPLLLRGSVAFPKIAAAQRLQSLLLITSLVAVLMGCVLLADLVRNFRSGVVADARKSLANAVTELIQARTSRRRSNRICGAGI